MGRNSYDDIVLLEISISNRSGGYKVKYDFEKNLITWTDSYMWNNNFMKHMNPGKTETMRTKLPKTDLLDWVEAYRAGKGDTLGNETANPSTWEVSILFNDDERLSATSTQHFPKKWNQLKLLVEETTACSFRLH